MILTEFSAISRRQSGSFVNGSSDSSSEQLQMAVVPDKSGQTNTSSALIDFETEVESPVSKTTTASREFFINAKYDFTRRSDAE